MAEYVTWQNPKSHGNKHFTIQAPSENIANEFGESVKRIVGSSNVCTHADTDGLYAKYVCKDEQIAKDLFKRMMNYRFGFGFYKEDNMIRIKKVIFNDPVTVVIWKDKTKTVVRARNEPFDPEKGLAMAIAKKALGNKYDYYDIFNKWIPKEKNNER